MTTEINWGYNCLTSDIHHGRQEDLWRIPLLHAIFIMVNDLKELVVARIYNDAMQFVEHGNGSQEWADRVKDLADERYQDVLVAKMSELHDYYASSSWDSEIEGVVELVKKDKLNPRYKPLHDHDSINMLCRILGDGCSRTALREAGSTETPN